MAAPRSAEAEARVLGDAGAAVRTEGFLRVITRREAREEEVRPGCKKVLFRCSKSGNEDKSLTDSPVKDVQRPTLLDHRQWNDRNMNALFTISELDPATVHRFVRDISGVMQAYDDQMLAWAVECGNRLVEFLDKIVVKQARNLIDLDLKRHVAARPTYMQLLRYLLRNWMPPFHREIEELLTSVEDQACKELIGVPNFPTDADDLRVQMLFFSDAKDLRDSKMHMGYKEGKAEILTRVSKVAQLAKDEELHDNVLKASGVLVGGIHLIKKRQSQMEAEQQMKAASAILGFADADSEKQQLPVKQSTLELSVNVDWRGESLYLLGDTKELGNGDLTKALPLFPSSKGWSRKVKVDYDFHAMKPIRCNLVLKRSNGEYTSGPAFNLTANIPAVHLIWEDQEKVIDGSC